MHTDLVLRFSRTPTRYTSTEDERIPGVKAVIPELNLLTDLQLSSTDLWMCRCVRIIFVLKLKLSDIQLSSGSKYKLEQLSVLISPTQISEIIREIFPLLLHYAHCYSNTKSLLLHRCIVFLLSVTHKRNILFSIKMY